MRSPALEAAVVHALGEDDRAFALLDRALESNDYWLGQLHSAPLFELMRDDARFKELVKKVDAR